MATTDSDLHATLFMGLNPAAMNDMTRAHLAANAKMLLLHDRHVHDKLTRALLDEAANEFSTLRTIGLTLAAACGFAGFAAGLLLGTSDLGQFLISMLGGAA